jgi:hypothetical protein
MVSFEKKSNKSSIEGEELKNPRIGRLFLR